MRLWSSAYYEIKCVARLCGGCGDFMFDVVGEPLGVAKQRQVLASDEATLQLVQTMIPGRFQVSPNDAVPCMLKSFPRRSRA